MTADNYQRLSAQARKVIECVTYDDSGFLGRGGNGGLLSRDTIRAVDELRLVLDGARISEEIETAVG